MLVEGQRGALGVRFSVMSSWLALAFLRLAHPRRGLDTLDFPRIDPRADPYARFCSGFYLLHLDPGKERRVNGAVMAVLDGDAAARDVEVEVAAASTLCSATFSRKCWCAEDASPQSP